LKRRLLILLGSLAVALPVAAQSDCAANLRCGQVPWQLPVMPVLVSPTPLATTAAQVVQPTQASGLINPTPAYCDQATPGAQSTNYRAAVASTRPTAWWPMDETAGTVMNDAAGTRSGTYTGATLNSYTLAGGAAPGFDGVNDKAYATAVQSIFNGNNFTLSLWMRVATNWSGSATVAYFGENGNVFSITRSGGSVVLTSGGAQASASASAAGTGWVHVAAVINRAVMGGQSGRLYLNGQSAATANMAPGTFTTATTLFLASSGTASYFAGGIGQVALYNRALTPAEIAILANASPSGTPSATNDARCGPAPIPTSPVDISGITNTMATLQTLPINQVGIANPQAGFDLYSGTATFFSYVLGIQSINLGILTPVVTFIFWSFFSFVGIKVAFILLPIIAALVGVIRKILGLVLDFLPF
jgi:hypothetical protein